MAMIGELLRGLVELVGPWPLLVVVVVAGVFALPGWLEGLRVKRVKALLRRVTRAEPAERERLIAEAWALAEGRPEVLLALALAADRMNLPHLRDRAVRVLRSYRGHADAVRRFEPPERRGRRFGHPVEACVSIERLLDVGAVEAARERFREAEARFEGEACIEALRQRLAEEAGPLTEDRRATR